MKYLPTFNAVRVDTLTPMQGLQSCCSSYLEDVSNVPSVVFSHNFVSGPVPQYQVQIITTRCQQLPTEREIDTIDAALMSLQFIL